MRWRAARAITVQKFLKEKRIEGISELRDESDKDGVRVVIELRRGEVGEIVLNNLYQQTQLQTVFGIKYGGADQWSAEIVESQTGVERVYSPSPRSGYPSHAV